MTLLITAEEARSYLDYDPVTGVFTWKLKCGCKVPGTVCSHLSKAGYVRIGFRGRLYQAHRLAWLYMTGDWPPEQVDHIDGVRSNNAWSNLRAATNAENTRNSKLPCTNSSGFKGVSWSKEVGKWHAYVKKDGRRKHLGYFSEKDEAARVVCDARLALHGPFANHGRSTSGVGRDVTTGRAWR